MTRYRIAYPFMSNKHVGCFIYELLPSISDPSVCIYAIHIIFYYAANSGGIAKNNNNYYIIVLFWIQLVVAMADEAAIGTLIGHNHRCCYSLSFLLCRRSAALQLLELDA